MYENNLVSQYISAVRKVKDWDKFAADCGGVVAIRAAYVPISRWTDGVLSGNYYNSDTARTDNDILREDPDYKTNFTNARAKGLKIITVIEFNPAYDRESDYGTKYQFNQVRTILGSMGSFFGDAFAVQALVYQWIESNKVKTIPAPNFRKAISIFINDLWDKYQKTVFIWSQKSPLKAFIKLGDSVYDYNKEFTTMLDLANQGEPTWPVGFTYLPDRWKKVNETTPGPMYAIFDSLRDSISSFPILTSAEVNDELRIGSYQGWMATNKAGNMKNHGFWGLYGPKLSYLTNSAGVVTYSEPLIFDTDKVTFFQWMGWQVVVPPPPPDDGDGGEDTGNDDGNIDLSEYVKKVDYEADKALQKIAIDELVSQFANFKQTFIDEVVNEVVRRLQSK